MNNIITQEEKDRIDSFCKKHRITNYSINGDGSIDVDGGVILAQMRLKQIPIKFNKVSGSFYCGYNGLTSLVGCPVQVGGYFDCANNSLTSLNGCPAEVGSDFRVYDNELTSLEYCPKKIAGHLLCSGNKITTLKGSPEVIGANFNCHINRLTSLEHCPKEIGGIFIFSHNRLPKMFTSLFEYDDDTDYDTNNVLTREVQQIFFKYQSYYGVWTPELNLDGMNDLIAEIKDGLE
jgi:hypothetical protein